jgi:hypothetical protein
MNTTVVRQPEGEQTQRSQNLHTPPVHPSVNLVGITQHLGQFNVNSAGDSPTSWSVEQLAVFLEGLSFVNAASVVRKNCVDGKTLLCLKEDELKDELGLSKLQVKRLLTDINVMLATAKSGCG